MSPLDVQCVLGLVDGASFAAPAAAVSAVRTMLLFDPTDVAAVAFLGWLAAGTAVGFRLHRSGARIGVAAAALGLWPLLLGSGPRRGGGPLGDRIDEAFDALTEALADPMADSFATSRELDRLRGSLHDADRRLALVDRLLSEAPEPDDEAMAASWSRLRAARAHAASEAEAVLSGVLQLRIQVGLRALAGDAVEVGDTLTELQARLSALDELGELTG